ncbi:MAG TPA: hypothetical protein VMM13_15210, partial [Euzebya sp.]|nr:hypothetical protein [Euzebya sp.]
MHAEPPPITRLLSAAVIVLLALNGIVLSQPVLTIAGVDRSAKDVVVTAASTDRSAVVEEGLALAPQPPALQAAAPPGALAAEVVVPIAPPAPPGQDAATAPVFPSRIRGVWVHVLDDVLLSRASIARMLDQVVAGGGNTVVVEVARRYD